MSRAAQEFRTWYVEEPEYFDGPPFLRIKRDSSDVSVVTPLLPRRMEEERDALLQRMISGLVSELRPRRLISWYYTPMALRFTDELEADRCVYDNMDELSTFAGAPPGLLEWEEKLLSRCDVVYVGGHSLFKAKRHRHDNIHVFPSSVDAAHFRQARALFDDPIDQRDIPHPRLGFFGVVDERMNIDLVREIAALRPDWHLVMIGPTAKIDPENLPRAANIHWLGCKDYRDLPKYLAGWDVGIMPFAINEATRYISPTKTPEFLAAGVPVVSTPITDVVIPYGAAGLVEIAADAEGFVAKADVLLARRRAPWLRSVDAFLEGNSWDDTWAAMRRRLDAFIPDRRTKREARRV
ncbi:glycosyltransferase [Methylocystis echinoides]|uniref:Glycosyl transferase n=1 Tax=Methylocystis echinoides TaxID=29468 RepID=A0A9W6LQZ5_9HYPH|nr:glycosyltransferase [Methylocystis echinoides]GLI91897.1 glycosyl transferase [Methylocystis echinoides]